MQLGVKCLIASTLFVFMLGSCTKEKSFNGCQGFELEPTSGVTLDEELVVKSYLLEYYEGCNLIHLVQRVDGASGNRVRDELIENQITGFDSTTIENYIIKNESISFWDTIEIDRLSLITEQELMCLGDTVEEYWEKYYSKYKKSCGYLIITRPIYNDTGNEALFETGHLCGPLCGYGTIIIMELKSGSWKTKLEIETWVS